LEEYRFHTGVVPSGYRVAFECSLFNQPGFLQLQSRSGWLSFYILHEKKKEIHAFVHFHLHGEVVSSPLKSPFGSVECGEELPPQQLYSFIDFIEEELKKKNVKQVIIKNPPTLYRAGFLSMLQVFLMNKNYQVKHAEVGAVIQVNEDPFDKVIDGWEKRKLKQAVEANLRFREIEADKLSEVYFFILGCRKQKGYSLSMTLHEIKETFTHFYDRYRLMGVYDQDVLVAATIAVRVNEQVVYNFYSDHDQAYHHLSPVVLLMEGLYRYCQKNNCSMLDLGTSAAGQHPNFKLLDFKMRLGAQATTKLTFEKSLS